MTTSAPLRGESLRLGYDKRVVSDGLDVGIPDGEFTAIIGPNACGKSTLLRALARVLTPQSGTVLLNGQDIHSRKTIEVARELGLLPQTSTAPPGITVTDLVSRGRFAHQRFLRRWSPEDAEAVQRAMVSTRTDTLADRQVEELSGGQRQRVWLATVLAQETPLLLLDEPTTFLDISHQIEVLEMCTTLHREGRTLVAVLHDLNQAFRYATHLIAMKDGAVVAQGSVHDIVTPELIEEVFGLTCLLIDDPTCDAPMVVPTPGPGEGATQREHQAAVLATLSAQTPDHATLEVEESA